MTTRRCLCHCSKCGGHFTSLAAFDAHREGPAGSDRECSYPDDADLREVDGDCLITSEARRGVVLFELGSRVDRAREDFKRRQGGARRVRRDV